jgi:hypothetical protein
MIIRSHHPNQLLKEIIMINTHLFTNEFVDEEIAFMGMDRDVKIGKVELVNRTLPPMVRMDHYLNVHLEITERKIPTYYRDGQLWMSMTAMEVQSHAVPLALAEGIVGVAGLGIGYFVLRAMDDLTVDSIDVYEQDEECIDLFVRQFKDREGFDKVSFILGDARENMRDKLYDMVFVDIYQTLLPDEVIEDITLFCDNNFISCYRFWGQEKVFATVIQNHLEERVTGLGHVWFTPEDFFFLNSHQDSEGGKLRDTPVDLGFCLEALDAMEYSEIN